MSTEALFETASRKRYRFESSKGALSVEDLWELPLSGKGVNLDEVAKTLYRKTNGDATISFVSDTNSVSTDLRNQFDIVKYVINVKLAERQKQIEAANRAEQRQAVLAAIAEKRTQELVSGSIEDLEKKLAALT